MRVVVAGGAGFIGATLCERLLDRGDRVVCVDNLVTGQAAHVARLEGRTGFEWVHADVSVAVPVDGPVDAVCNLACPASPVDFGPLALEILAVGSAGVGHLLDLAADRGARYLQASTSEVYGDPLVHPQPETYWGNVNPIGPRSVYDEAKRFGEALTMAHHRSRGTDVCIVRIFNTYGWGMRPDDGRVISNFVTQALAGRPLTVYGDGDQTRSFCYVDDLVDGILAALAWSGTGPVNLGNDAEYTMLATARMVLEVTGSSAPIEHRPLPVDDPTQRRPDLTLARAELGFAPQVALVEGLARTVAWFAGGAGPPG